MLRKLYWLLRDACKQKGSDEVRSLFEREGFGIKVLDNDLKQMFITLVPKSRFKNIKGTCRLEAECFVDENNIVHLGCVSLEINVNLALHELGGDAVFKKRSGFSDLMDSPDIPKRAGEFGNGRAIGISYNEIVNSWIPIQCFGFDVELTIFKDFESTSNRVISYEACSGLDDVVNIVTGKRERAKGTVLREFPRVIKDMSFEKVKGPRPGKFF